MNQILRRTGRAFTIAAAAGLAGCNVGPNYTPPKPKLSSAYGEPLERGAVAGATDLTHWWTVLKDPTLDSLIDRAVAGSPTLREATARVVEARAQRTVVAADLYPTVDATGAYNRSRTSSNIGFTLNDPNASAGGQGNILSDIPGSELDFYQVGFDAAWEIDVFGHTRRSIEAADAGTQAAQEARRDALVTLMAEVARTYVQVRSLQARIQIANDNARAQQESAELSRARSAAGLASELDPLRAEAQLAATRSQVPALEAQLKTTIHRLGVLLGQDPASLLDELSSPAPVPGIPDQIAVGIPSDLLRRRPDIRRAERELEIATANIGVATADLFPRFSITGSFGFESSDVGNLFSADSRFWAIGPAVRWPVFQGGRIRGNIRVQNARQEQALARYETTLLTALEDVENALVNYSREQARRDTLREGVGSANTAVDLARELNTRGLTDFLSVLDAQRQAYTLQEQLAISEAAVTSNLIALYKALGGGWEAMEPPRAPAGSAAAAPDAQPTPATSSSPADQTAPIAAPTPSKTPAGTGQ